MAMNGAALGDSIAGIITAPNAPDDMKKKIKAQWELIGAAIVSHIQANAVVTVSPGIAVATTGSSSAQAGATTTAGTGTVA